MRNIFVALDRIALVTHTKRSRRSMQIKVYLVKYYPTYVQNSPKDMSILVLAPSKCRKYEYS